MIENGLDFLQGEIKASTSVGEAKRAIHVAGAVHFNNAHAHVLFVVGTKAAVVGTAMLDFSRKLKWDGAWLVKPGRVGVGLSVTIYQRLKISVVRAGFAHVDLVVS
jgi:hypothetical protein